MKETITIGDKSKVLEYEMGRSSKDYDEAVLIVCSIIFGAIGLLTPTIITIAHKGLDNYIELTSIFGTIFVGLITCIIGTALGFALGCLILLVIEQRIVKIERKILNEMRDSIIYELSKEL